MDTSPFSRHFDTNYAPSDQEVGDIKQIIRSHQNIVDNINKKIREFEERRRVHAKAIEKHSALLSPIKRIPPEILSFIFIACQTRRTCSVDITSRKHPTLVIIHVCQHWRSIALNLPLLWSRVHIAAPSVPLPRYSTNSGLITDPAKELYMAEVGAYDRKLEAVKEATTMWLARSANCPLDISFSSDDSASQRPDLQLSARSISWTQWTPPSTSTTSFNSFIVNLLLDTSRRWKRITLSLSVTQSNSPLLRLLTATDIPQLEEVQLFIGVQPSYLRKSGPINKDGSPPLSIDLLGTPAVHSLRLSFLWVPIAHIPINWAAITELYLGPHLRSSSYGSQCGLSNSHEALTLLASCRNIVRCFLTLRTDSVSPQPQKRRIKLPYLNSMSIQGSYLPKYLASSLILPSLRRLFILGTDLNPNTEPESPVLEWVKNFGDLLTEMTFVHPTLTQSALIYCLEHLPNVETLRMIDTRSVEEPERSRLRSWVQHWTPPEELGREPPSAAVISDYVLQALTPSLRTQSCCCPRLKRFSCRMTDVEFSEKGLLDFIVARRQLHTANTFASGPAIARLERVVIKFSIAQTMDIKKELASLAGESDLSSSEIDISSRVDLDLDHFVLVTKYGHLGRRLSSSGFDEYGYTTYGGDDDFLLEEQLVLSDHWSPHYAEWW